MIQGFQPKSTYLTYCIYPSSVLEFFRHVYPLCSHQENQNIWSKFCLISESFHLELTLIGYMHHIFQRGSENIFFIYNSRLYCQEFICLTPVFFVMSLNMHIVPCLFLHCVLYKMIVLFVAVKLLMF